METCQKTGKIKYTRAAAKNQARWFREIKLARMHHFRCKACKSWHIGNSSVKPKVR